MATLTLRSVKGTPLTNNEVDGNFTSLNTAKYESGDSPTFADLTLTGMPAPLVWNADDGTVDIPLNADVTLQAGQEFVYYGKASGAISNGQVVMFSGVEGSHPIFTVADIRGTGFIPEYIMGIATQDFANNEFGYVTALGKVRGYDTSVLGAGVVLYIDPATPGGLTATKPGSEDFIITIAATMDAKNNGTLLVRATGLQDLSTYAEIQASITGIAADMVTTQAIVAQYHAFS
jgi:hypothetical protein